MSFMKQPNILDLLKERQSVSTNSHLRNKVLAIRNEGMEALERFANDEELIVLLRCGTNNPHPPMLFILSL